MIIKGYMLGSFLVYLAISDKKLLGCYFDGIFAAKQ